MHIVHSCKIQQLTMCILCLYILQNDSQCMWFAAKSGLNHDPAPAFNGDANGGTIFKSDDVWWDCIHQGPLNSLHPAPCDSWASELYTDGSIMHLHNLQDHSKTQAQALSSADHCCLDSEKYNTSCRLNSHHAAKGTSCVAGAVKNTRHITPLKSHHGQCFLQWFIAGTNDFRKSWKVAGMKKHCARAVKMRFFHWNHQQKSTKHCVRGVIKQWSWLLQHQD